MNMKKICIFGNDKRMLYLAKLFHQSEFEVEHYITINENKVYNGDYFIFSVGTEIDYIKEIIDRNPLSLVFVGNSEITGNKIFDYFKDEVVTIKNTIPTAEGAIATAIKETDTTLFGSKCLILGYGKVAKTLAGYLGCFGAKVTIAARKETDRVLASINLFDSMIINELENEIHKYDIIFNTIPVKIIDSHILRKVRNEALIIDLASKPGGVDFKEAELLKKRVVWALGLPGKYAYKTAALYIYDYIINVIKGDEL